MRLRAPLLYDTVLLPLEHFFIRRWRNLLWSRIEGSNLLEAGAGTGLNMDFYGKEHCVTALEIEEAALKLARSRAGKKQVQVEFVLGDVENLPFSDEQFDAVVATFLFCSVHNPVQGLSELHRVLKSGGKLYLLEHVRSEGGLGKIMDAISQPFYRLFEEHIARETDKNVSKAGFVNISQQALFLDVVKNISADK